MPPADRLAHTDQAGVVHGTGDGHDRGRLSGLGLWASTAARLILGAVFAAAALAKIGDTQAIVRSVRAYQILPERLVHPVAYALPYLELAVAFLLLIGLGTRIVAVHRGRHARCCSSPPFRPPASVV